MKAPFLCIASYHQLHARAHATTIPLTGVGALASTYFGVIFTFEHFRGTNRFRASYPGRRTVKLNNRVMILVVEDDQLIQLLVEEALSDGGFEPTFTTAGEEAVTFLRDEKSAYRAVVSDINLAGKLDGWEVARIARESDPAMPVIYMTGTQEEEWASKGVPNSVLLAKPFAPAQLVTAIANLLNTASSPAPPAE